MWSKRTRVKTDLGQNDQPWSKRVKMGWVKMARVKTARVKTSPGQNGPGKTDCRGQSGLKWAGSKRANLLNVVKTTWVKMAGSGQKVSKWPGSKYATVIKAGKTKWPAVVKIGWFKMACYTR